MAFTPYIRQLGRAITADDDKWLTASVERGDVFVADEGGRIVGVAATDRRENGLFLDRLAVDPARLGTGLGSWLLVRLEEVARAKRRWRLLIVEQVSEPGGDLLGPNVSQRRTRRYHRDAVAKLEVLGVDYDVVAIRKHDQGVIMASQVAEGGDKDRFAQATNAWNIDAETCTGKKRTLGSIGSPIDVSRILASAGSLARKHFNAQDTAFRNFHWAFVGGGSRSQRDRQPSCYQENASSHFSRPLFSHNLTGVER